MVGVIMGSKSDWEWMQHACATLEALRVPYEARVVSAHRTPDAMFRYAEEAEARGLEVIIAGAGGAAHLPGMVAAKTLVPVLGVPIPATLMQGVDALLSIAQMPGGVPVGTLAVGKPGAINAAVFAAEIVGNKHHAVRERVRAWRKARTEEALAMTVGVES
jgi:5-(carboxyamino)imidazole ribonucleotide mutase